jgi:hypothetical protein
VANDALAAPEQAKVIRAGKDRLPITDGLFPAFSSRESQ